PENRASLILARRLHGYGLATPVVARPASTAPRPRKDPLLVSARCDVPVFHGCDSSLASAAEPGRCVIEAAPADRATRSAESTLPARYRCEAGWPVLWHPACPSSWSRPSAVWLPVDSPAWGSDPSVPSHLPANCNVHWLPPRSWSVGVVAPETHGKAGDHVPLALLRRHVPFRSQRRTLRTSCVHHIR